MIRISPDILADVPQIFSGQYGYGQQVRSPAIKGAETIVQGNVGKWTQEVSG